ncbi:hypothetical protein AB0M52_24475, partial [Micromonospora sp. NPDC051296]
DLSGNVSHRIIRRVQPVSRGKQGANLPELVVWRTPTVLLVDGDGRVARRASGVPDAGQLTEAVRELSAGATR